MALHTSVAGDAAKKSAAKAIERAESNACPGFFGTAFVKGKPKGEKKTHSCFFWFRTVRKGSQRKKEEKDILGAPKLRRGLLKQLAGGTCEGIGARVSRYISDQLPPTSEVTKESPDELNTYQ